ncbi:hypothetical protein, partial [Neisseria bacilliformis]|uniref:hypothetical protein n=1 Tax=Neisseria bacilliformis TaxID=267212 RepID=UPI0028F14D23
DPVQNGCQNPKPIVFRLDNKPQSSTGSAISLSHAAILRAILASPAWKTSACFSAAAVCACGLGSGTGCAAFCDRQAAGVKAASHIAGCLSMMFPFLRYLFIR